MATKIDKAIEYYTFKSKKILDHINTSNTLTVDEIIENGQELAILEYKITALEVAKAS
jgi:hypothetical protein